MSPNRFVCYYVIELSTFFNCLVVSSKFGVLNLVKMNINNHNQEYAKFNRITQRRQIIRKVILLKRLDVFRMEKYGSLAHCVSRNFKMSAGIAKDFRYDYLNIIIYLLFGMIF